MLYILKLEIRCLFRITKERGSLKYIRKTLNLETKSNIILATFRIKTLMLLLMLLLMTFFIRIA